MSGRQLLQLHPRHQRQQSALAQSRQTGASGGADVRHGSSSFDLVVRSSRYSGATGVTSPQHSMSAPTSKRTIVVEPLDFAERMMMMAAPSQLPTVPSTTGPSHAMVMRSSDALKIQNQHHASSGSPSGSERLPVTITPSKRKSSSAPDGSTGFGRAMPGRTSSAEAVIDVMSPSPPLSRSDNHRNQMHDISSTSHSFRVSPTSSDVMRIGKPDAHALGLEMDATIAHCPPGQQNYDHNDFVHSGNGAYWEDRDGYPNPNTMYSDENGWQFDTGNAENQVRQEGVQSAGSHEKRASDSDGRFQQALSTGHEYQDPGPPELAFKVEADENNLVSGVLNDGRGGPAVDEESYDLLGPGESGRPMPDLEEFRTTMKKLSESSAAKILELVEVVWRYKEFGDKLNNEFKAKEQELNERAHAMDEKRRQTTVQFKTFVGSSGPQA
ncbi:hypothetical protein DFJ73DRAFT_236671 [Zopfochytrium polystomum]|nr:hypothetical protein DFJ73DRAFT_236671 [Zopfochytrium polystomum]